MELFCNFFGIFYYASCRNGTDRRFLFFLFLGIFQPILTWNEAIMVYFNFPNFIAIFLEFSVSRLVGTERNGTIIFIFSHSRPFQTYFGLKGPQWYFLIFSIFLLFFFLIFYYASWRNGTDRKFLFFLFLGIFQPILAWNEAVMVYFNFFNFIAIFLEFSVSRRVGTERNYNFYILSFSAFSNLFWLEGKS